MHDRRSPTDNIIPQVRAMSAYTLERRDSRIKLNQNEAPWDLPAALKQQVLERVAAMPWNRYPDFHPADVLEALGKRHGLPPESVLIGNGSNELLQAIFAACAGAGVPIALPAPTFSLYKAMALANEAAVELVPLRPDLSWDRERLEALATERRAHLLICNPNNPTGSAVDAAFIDRLCQLTDRLVIVDEAYIQFADEGTAADHLIARHPHLIVLRTLSKAAGLAGIRFGYALGSPEVMREISKIKLPYNIGHFGLEVIRCVLADEVHIPARVKVLLSERERVRAALVALGVHVWPSQANFLLFGVHDTHAVFEHLAAHDILIRDVSHYPMLAGCLRVTLGAPEDNDAFLHHIAEALPGAPARPAAPEETKP